MRKMYLRGIMAAALCLCMLCGMSARHPAQAAETGNETELKTIEVKTSDDMKQLAKRLGAAWNESKKDADAEKGRVAGR